MGLALGKDLVAEGIETEAQARALEQCGCSSAQGFYFAPALPADEFVRFFHEHRGLSEQGAACAPGVSRAKGPLRRVLAYTTVLVLACASLPALSAPPMQFTRLAAEDGLSQGAVMAMLEDSQGFLWLGTEDGLDRYDGYEVRRYVHDRTQSRSLPDNWVSTLAQDRTGTLWIGTAGGGVVGRNPNTGALVRLGVGRWRIRGRGE